MKKRGGISVLGLALMILVAAGAAQTRGSWRVDESKFRGAANRWMLRPVDIATQQDTATPAERAMRDLHWDRATGQDKPLSEEQTSYLLNFDGAQMRNPPEFPTIRNGVWVVGKFESYHTFLSASHRCVYTEINVRAEHVFGHDGAPGLKEGALIDIGQGGGSVIAPWGATVTYNLRPRRFALQPGHRYLLLLQYRADGNYYLEAKRWELTRGTVEPDEEVEVDRVRRGKSELNGLTIPEMLQLLDRKFAAKPN